MATTMGDQPVILDNGSKIQLRDVYVVPELAKNLVSVSKMLAQGAMVFFDDEGAKITRSGKPGEVIATATWQNGLCFLNGKTIEMAAANVVAKENDTLIDWHKRLGHVHTDAIAMLENHDLATGVHVTDHAKVSVAPVTKSTTATTDTSASAPTDEIGAVIGIDIKTDLKPRDYAKNKQLLHMVEYATGYGEIFPMKRRKEWFGLATAFITKFERQHDVNVKVVRGDNEFRAKKMVKWCEQKGIRMQLTEPGESSSNGKVERRHRTVCDGMRAMLFDAPAIPRSLWTEAAKHQSWLRNRLPTRSNAGHMSPIEA
ncbi:TPA: LOW QUALITY PROTEIN: hypothetical protein N0F65_003089 [Lagenidium giganteum]|uniref:Integrase catalytic domain-containing protein n=1 Tax=Lagenidium giganteum TaxID=4803 RepID=A0AAV2YQJ3_9STRA|nr:TPA: LOW QUALITY PROTEIN: hypothetical protein N0F65_003089 [Lagenidium giganteum]